MDALFKFSRTLLYWTCFDIQVTYLTVQQMIARARSEARVCLTEMESKELLGQAGIDTIETRLAASRPEAIATSQKLGFPVALKINSPDITHKSDAGGVRLNLETPEQVGRAYDEIMARVSRRHPQARLQGTSVQRMAPPGMEVIIGTSQDAQFGPVLMFGLGGVWVEVLKDVSLRIIPVTRGDAEAMIREIRGYPLLTGYRGGVPVDLARLADCLVKVADFALRHPMVRELDLNPVIANCDVAVVVDARVILEEPDSKGN
jgi:acyl-CoA synthetase (NDP forming)